MNHTNGVFAAVLRPSILVAAFSALMAGFAPDIEATELGDRGLTQASRSGRPTLPASASESGAEVWFGAALSLLGPGLEDDTRLRVLRPIDWFEERGLSRPGDRVFLELPELGVSGWASLERMWEHGPLEPGPGRLVLSTTETTSNDVYELSFIEDAEALRGTGSHPLYSLDRDDWVRVRDLQVGERLQTAEGAVTVEALEKVRGVHRVYNLEVDADHEYLVGEAGVRAHNMCADEVARSGRGKNKLLPDPDAAGPHSTFKRGADGKVSNHAEWTPNPRNPSGFDEVKRVDVTGRPHRNPDGTIVPTPHTKVRGQRGVRPSTPDELPR